MPAESLLALLKPARLLFAAPRSVARVGYDLLTRHGPQAPDSAYETIVRGGVSCERGAGPGQIADRTLLYLHGGGFVLGSARGYRVLAGSLAEKIGAESLVPDYRLAPEHPYPAALHDVTAVYESLLEFGRAPGSIVLAGDSAGGGLILSALVAWRERGLPLPVGAALFSPWTDFALTGDSITAKAEADPLLTRDILLGMTTDYLAARASAPTALSPLHLDLRGLPPLLLQVGSEEILLDDSTRLANRAEAAQVPVQLQVWPGQFHVFQLFFATIPAAAQAIDAAATFLREKLAPPLLPPAGA